MKVVPIDTEEAAWLGQERAGTGSAVLITRLTATQPVPVLPFKLGAPLHDINYSKLLHVSEALAKSLGDNPHFAQTSLADWWVRTTKDTFMEITFPEPTHIYVLFHESMIPKFLPEWMVQQFDIDSQSQYVRVAWNIGFPENIGYLLARNLDMMLKAKMHAFKSKESKTTFCLGAPDGQRATHVPYVLVWPQGMRDIAKEQTKTIEAVPAHEDADFYRKRLQQAAQEAATADGNAVAEQLDHRLMLLKFCEDVDISRMCYKDPELESQGAADYWVPLVRIGIDKGSEQLVWELLAHGAEMDEHCLAWLIGRLTDRLDLEAALAQYIMRTRNPMASAMVISRELHNAAKDSRASGREHDLLKLSDVFHVLALTLVDDLRVGEALEMVGSIVMLEDVHVPSHSQEGKPSSTWMPLASVLDPAEEQQAGQPRAWTINDASPLKVAKDTNDTDFTACPTVQRHLKEEWLGGDYSQLSLQRDDNHVGEFSQLNNISIANILIVSGLIGRLGAPFFTLMFKIFHLWFLVPHAFFDSPRGRWAMCCLAQYILLTEARSDVEDVKVSWQHYCFAIFVLGQVVDEGNEVFLRFHGSLHQYVHAQGNIVDWMAICLLLAAGAMHSALAWGMWDEDNNAQAQDMLTARDITFALAGIFIWAQSLDYLVPVYNGFGPVIRVMWQMAWEVCIFLVPAAGLMFGVSCAIFMLTARYDNPDQLQRLDQVFLNYIQTQLQVFDWTRFDDIDNPAVRAVGQALLIIWTLFAAIVMANLLIAMVSQKYRPEAVDAQSKLEQAKRLDHYKFMVDKNLIGSPFSFVMLLLAWVPAAKPRRKNGLVVWGRLLPMFLKNIMNELDGWVLGGDQLRTRPRGKDALPYNIYLLTLHLLFGAIFLAMWFTAVPASILYFSFVGWRGWAEKLSTGAEQHKAVPSWKKVFGYLVGVPIAALIVSLAHAVVATLTLLFPFVCSILLAYVYNWYFVVEGLFIANWSVSHAMDKPCWGAEQASMFVPMGAMLTALQDAGVDVMHVPKLGPGVRSCSVWHVNQHGKVCSTRSVVKSRANSELIMHRSSKHASMLADVPSAAHNGAPCCTCAENGMLLQEMSALISEMSVQLKTVARPTG